MEWLSYVYFLYMFIGLYLALFYIIIYLKNRKNMFDYPRLTESYPLSIVIPCYNEEKFIGNTIQRILDSDYKGLKKVIVVDDCSTDNSYEFIKKIAEKNDKVLAVQTPENTGNAAGAKNFGSNFVETELIGFTDADSFPEKDAISKMVGYFDREKVGAVTCSIFVKNTKRFFTKLQAIEYATIIWSRKLLGYVDAIYVTPGPLAIYRKKVFEEIGKFDEKNLTEDIEMTWRLAKYGYKRELSVPARVWTYAPEKFKQWWKQRIRWNVGGIQTINKYKQYFLKKGTLGFFILPFFIVSLSLGLVGLSIFVYLILRRIYFTYIFTNLSFSANTSLLTLEEFYITPSILNYFGISLFLLGLAFTLFALNMMRKQKVKKVGFFTLIVYMVVYLTLYPIILLTSVYKFARGTGTWGTK